LGLLTLGLPFISNATVNIDEQHLPGILRVLGVLWLKISLHFRAFA
jgi:hypothetical protein